MATENGTIPGDQQDFGVEHADDGLDSSLRAQFEKEGAKIDVPTYDDKPNEKEGEEEPVQNDEDPEKGDGDAREGDPKPEKSDGEIPKVKSPFPAKAKAKPEPIAPKKEDGVKDPSTIADPKGMSQGNAKGWKELKENNTKTYQAYVKEQEKSQKLEQMLAEKATTTNKEVETMKKELEELRGYRASFDHQFNPEFKKQYSEPMGKLESEMRKMLTTAGVNDQVMKTLDWTDSGQMDRVAKSVETHVNSIAADRFRTRAKDYIELASKKEEFLEEFRGKHEQFKQQKAQEMERSFVEEGARSLKHVNSVAVSKDEKGGYKYPFLLKFEADSESTQEQIQQIEKHNALADEMRGKLNRMLSFKSPEDRSEVAIAAVAASYMSKELKAEREVTASLRKSLEKYNKVSTEKKGPESSAPYKKPETLELDDALSASFPHMKIS